MKSTRASGNSSRHKKVACTVSAAALMLGVSSAATVGLHFQENYCGSPSYSGFPVTLTAFGIESNGWESLIAMPTGYACPITSGPFSYTFNELIDTETSTNGLNPLPNGSLNVTWSANDANFSGFAGYGGNPPNYAYDGPPPTPIPTGEWQIYSTFLRDGVNFGLTASGQQDYINCGDNNVAGYLVDVTGLRSVFTNGVFVVELIAASDSMQKLTNAFVIDVTSSTTNSVSYPSTPTPYDEGGTCGQWLRGHGGGLSTASGVLNTDHIQIMSSYPQHGGIGVPPNGYDNAGTISGFIATDKPVVTMAPQSIPAAGPGDTIALSAYAIGVPPLAYQWQFNGANIAGATTTAYTISNFNLADGGGYALVVTNLYGATTSRVSTVSADLIGQSPASQIVYDSNPANAQNDGVNMGATWEASSSDGTVSFDGVMSFVATNSDGISVQDSPDLNGPTGTVTFWMRSAGTDQNANGNIGGSLICRSPGGNSFGKDFVLLQTDGSPGYLEFVTPGYADYFASANGVSDNKWHFIALTFDQSASGGVALYIDGALDTTNSNGGSWSWPAGKPLEIGYTSDATLRDYNGLLHDVRYYNAILSPSQMSAIYSSGALADTSALQARFSFAAAPGQGTVLTWKESSAVLQTASSLSGPWVDVTGAASPYTIVPAATQQFFRYRYVSQKLVSNPYLM